MWKQIIQDLIDAGMTQQQIAAASGMAQATVSTIYRGGIDEPGWTRGESLRRLHAERCSDKATPDHKAAA